MTLTEQANNKRVTHDARSQEHKANNSTHETVKLGGQAYL